MDECLGLIKQLCVRHFCVHPRTDLEIFAIRPKTCRIGARGLKGLPPEDRVRTEQETGIGNNIPAVMLSHVIGAPAVGLIHGTGNTAELRIALHFCRKDFEP